MNIEKFEVIYNENRLEIEDKQKLKAKLMNLLGESNVSTEEIDLIAYSGDTSLISFNWALQGKIASVPDFVVWPENKSQISEILKLANTEKIPIIPYGEGSGVVGGAIPILGGIILDMKKFNNIIELNDKDLTVTAEAGINGMNLERYLNAKGYTSGHIPQSLYTSSLGGWIAHRAAGQFSTKYGKIEDIVLGMEIVLPQGEIINFKPIVRTATGPQLDKLFLGNEGTLGIVTRATLRIWPLPEARALMSYAFPSIEDSFNATREILREHIFPAVIRIYDHLETERHFPEINEAKDKVMVIFVCEGIQKLVNIEEEITNEKCQKNKGISCGSHPVEHWLETRFKVTETSTMPPYKIVFDTIEVASSWDNAAGVYHNVIDSMNDLKGIIMITAHISHFYPNGVGIYFSFGSVPDKETSDLSLYQKCWDTIIKAVLNTGGSIAHHHGIGINRAHWMDEEWGNSMQLMRQVKQLLDPNNIFNPGKVYSNVWKRGER